MPWVCEYCGLENLQDDRIAMEEPPCTRCGKRRGALEHEIAELQDRIADYREFDEIETARLRAIDADIEDLKHQIGILRDGRETVIRAMHDNALELMETEHQLRTLQQGPQTQPTPDKSQGQLDGDHRWRNLAAGLTGGR